MVQMGGIASVLAVAGCDNSPMPRQLTPCCPPGILDMAPRFRTVLRTEYIKPNLSTDHIYNLFTAGPGLPLFGTAAAPTVMPQVPQWTLKLRRVRGLVRGK
jgi:hypothetical protein